MLVICKLHNNVSSKDCYKRDIELIDERKPSATIVLTNNLLVDKLYVLLFYVQ